MIDQYDGRRIQSENELDRLRRVEHESTVREIGDLRNEVGEILKIRSELDLRKAEETRLATMVGTIQGNMNSFNARIDDFQNSHTFLEEKERYNNKAITELQASDHERGKSIEKNNGSVRCCQRQPVAPGVKNVQNGSRLSNH